MIPTFSYNEDRPNFIGKDVEGIKDLNATLEQKYQLNKQAKIQSEDLLHSIGTFDKDRNIKGDAVTQFETDLQTVVDSNEYENASNVVESAVTKIKRNKGLQLEIGRASCRERV